MRIGVDIDGVIANLPKGFIDHYNTHYNYAPKDMTVDDLTDYDMDLSFNHPGICQRVFNEPEFFIDLEVMPGAVENLAKLVNDGHEVILLTVLPSSNGNVLTDKLDWLEAHVFPSTGLTRKDVVFCYSKKWFQGDFMIDDYPINLGLFAGTRVLVDWPYNRDGYGTDEKNNFTRLNQNVAWDEFYELVKSTKKRMVKGLGYL